MERGVGGFNKLTSNTSTRVSSTSIASKIRAMITWPSPRTRNAALNHAAGPWKMARKATWGRYATPKRNPSTRMDRIVNGISLLPNSGQNSRCLQKYQMPLKGYVHEALTTFRIGCRATEALMRVSDMISFPFLSSPNNRNVGKGKQTFAKNKCTGPFRVVGSGKTSALCLDDASCFVTCPQVPCRGACESVYRNCRIE